ncbi:unnamed protein product, partial [Gongylonema pulchrum]|uniref:Vps8 domain-containing protein n=1 Tax=Gongylonema pulchrum TaxID=637853 RepID=A0A183EN30_9BILA
MIGLMWVEPYYLVIVDADEKVHLIDIMQGEVAVEDASAIQLAYGTADFKGLSTGGNVSAALDYLANSVCYQSYCRVGPIAYLLGQSAVYEITVSDQIAQLENFINRGEVISAVLFALDIFVGKIGCRSRRANMRHVVSACMPDLVQTLLTLTTTGLENGKVVQLIDHYKKHIQLLVKACITTGRFDLLYNTIYASLAKDALSKAIFFEFIDEMVLDGKFENPPPALVSDYFHHLIAEGNLSQFEAAVVRIRVDKQDIHFVMTTC